MLRALPALLLALCLACDSTSDDPTPGGEACERFSFPLSAVTASNHVSSCGSTACGNAENPPNSGMHCPTWLPCQSYTTEQPRCSWLHNLEHGHAVFLYNCPEGCADEVAKLEAAQARAAQGSNGVRRALVAPDAQLPQRFAAMLWRRTYLMDSVDPDAIACLLALQDQDAPEPGLLCAP
ncbi:DUF3105 domain-containing protein [Corallococcus terminator]|uniref:DUF3105 domain-containing protein n=1 Tax=Corallococcus terminator TaxID=2316733 RepID=A0A3A8JAA1_9BACT|nr:DUF3105 domain-containing protein [Corallococcus terminator]RKG91978.1 DUF3105 domain-containing protein [Corallococcus terminator]